MVDVAGRSVERSLPSRPTGVRAAEATWGLVVVRQHGGIRPWPETRSQAAVRRVVSPGTASDTAKLQLPLQTPFYGRELGPTPCLRTPTQGCVASL